MNPAACHHNYLTAQETLQPYLEEIYSWTKENDLILNPDKSTATLFTPDLAEYNKTLNLRINNILIHTGIIIIIISCSRCHTDLFFCYDGCDFSSICILSSKLTSFRN